MPIQIDDKIKIVVNCDGYLYPMIYITEDFIYQFLNK